MELKRVVITGIGAITPIGNTALEYWDSLIKGKSGGSLIKSFDTTRFKTKFACEVKNFDEADFFSKKERNKNDLFTKFAIIASDEAIKDAEINKSKINLDRTGVIWGSGIGGIITFQNEIDNFISNNRNPKFSPFFIPKMIADIASGNISIRHGFRGINFSTVSACASSSNAIIDAFNYIRLNKADIIVTGGSEAAINEAGIGGFNALQALSKRNDSPETASRPFDKERDGFVMGEGSGSIILESLDSAIKREAKIYAEIVGGGMSADAHHITAPHPEGLGAFNVMKNALDDTNGSVSIEDIDYINVHGTSTPLGDFAESIAIKRVFGENAYNLNISSTKSMIGHLLGAAGAVEAIATIMAIKNNVIPPTINHLTYDEKLDPKLNFTFNKAQKREVKAALSNTFGFGGHNASIIFKEYIS